MTVDHDDPRLRIYAIEHIDRLGFYEGVPNADYHASAGVSKSSLDKIHKSINHWLNTPYIQRDHLDFGSAVHAKLMEPHLFAKEFRASSSNDKRSKEWKKEKAKAEQDGVILMPQQTYDNVSYAADAVMAHPVAGPWFERTDAIAEGSLWSEEPNTGILTRVRPDWLLISDGLCIDLKTTKDASPGDPGGGGGFPRSMGQFRYDVQEALYTDMLQQHFNRPFEFRFVAVENSPPWGVGVFQLDQDSVDRARFQYLSDMAKLIDFVENSTYGGGYPDEVQVVEVPKYFKRGI